MKFIVPVASKQKLHANCISNSHKPQALICSAGFSLRLLRKISMLNIPVSCYGELRFEAAKRCVRSHDSIDLQSLFVSHTLKKDIYVKPTCIVLWGTPVRSC